MILGECKHGDLSAEQLEETLWLDHGSCELEFLEGIVKNKRLLDALPFTTEGTSTSDLECFHSTVNAYATKRLSFSHGGLKQRYQCAILDFNENKGSFLTIFLALALNVSRFRIAIT